LPRGTGKQTKC